MVPQNHKHTILIADDSEMNRAILSDMLGEEYIILEAANGNEALQLIQSSGTDISLLLLDIVMPELDGFGVLTEMRRNHWIEEIPVIIISAESGASQVERAYELGVSDFITRPFDALIVHKRVVNTILLYAKQKRLVELVAAQVYEAQVQSNMMIDILSHIVEFRNGETGLHIRHVHVLTELLLEKLNQKGEFFFTQQEISIISTASALHDVGKIAIPEEILNKPGKLTDEEFSVMKSHTTIGGEMLRNLPIYQDKPLVKTAYEICRWHHERWDGRGYPDGLKGDEIPIPAQIVALADVYDALTSKRVYKGPFPHEEAVRMILNGECGVFSPLLMECFSELSDDILRAFSEDSMAEDSHQRLLEVTEEMLHHENFSVSRRTLQLMERERIRRDFFASLTDEIQFEFTLNPPQVTLSPFGAQKLGFPEVMKDPLHDPAILAMSDGDTVNALSGLLRSTSPGQPMVTFDCKLKVGGEERWYQIVARANWSSDEPPRYLGAIGKASDVHENRLQMANLERMASTDQLTGLPNHASARKQIAARLEERPHGRYAMAIFDLDLFKQANDTYGHLFGDQVLTHVASRLRDAIRGGDIVARVGGDEFLIFLEHKGAAEPAIRRVYNALCDTYNGFPITVSMGVSETGLVGYDYDDLFRAADKALYSIKKGQRGKGAKYVFYDDSMSQMASAISPLDADSQNKEGASDL